MNETNKTKRELALELVIAEQDKYIELLVIELQDVVWMASSHGWKSTRYEDGLKARMRIAQLKAKYTP